MPEESIILFPIFLGTTLSKRLGTGQWGDVSFVSSFGDKLRELTLFGSRSESVIVIFANYSSMLLRLKSLNTKTLHAYLSLLHAVKANQPLLRIFYDKCLSLSHRVAKIVKK